MALIDRPPLPTPQPTLPPKNEHPQLGADTDLRSAVQAAVSQLHQLIMTESEIELRHSVMLQSLIQVLLQRGVVTPFELEAAFTQVKKPLSEEKQEKINGPIVVPEEIAIGPSDLDCSKHHPICGAACCSTFNVFLTPAEAASNRYLWDLRVPYRLLADTEGTCVYFDKQALGCSIWQERPKACRAFDCRGDERVWEDYPDRRLSTQLMEKRARLAAEKQAARAAERTG